MRKEKDGSMKNIENELDTFLSNKAVLIQNPDSNENYFETLNIESDWLQRDLNPKQISF